MPGLDRLTLVDRDVYEAANLSSQDITPRDVGRKKAVVQARRAHRINPALELVAVSTPVENVPLGRLRADVILACLDGRSARQHVNEAAWRLGVPWIDAGVHGGSLLARVDVYRPGWDAACLECIWDEQDYAALEQTYPCAPAAAAPAATHAPSSLGALAASLQAIECRKLLGVGPGQSAPGTQIVLDAAHHKHYLTALKLAIHCRFDHEVWEIDRPGKGRRTLGDLFALARKRLADTGPLALRVEGGAFVRRLTCRECDHARRTLRWAPTLHRSEGRCRRCGGECFAAGFDMAERLDSAALSPRDRARSLRAIGLRAGDVVSIRGREEEVHLEIGDDAR
jgi:adenylyltransferase/sulfurtransferase